jgi:hypothetical protein
MCSPGPKVVRPVCTAWAFVMRVFENGYSSICAFFGKLGIRLLIPGLALLPGCTIHPVQQDVTGVPTHVLVNYIRCEARLAIQSESIDLLEKESAQNQVIEDLRQHLGLAWKPEMRSRLVGKELVIYDKYIRTGLAFDFSFDITESNGASAAADPIRLLTNGTAGIGLSASGKYDRQNLRHFIVSETARTLLENPDLPCSAEAAHRLPNYAYPISGNIGLKELISTFFELNEIKPGGLAHNKSISSSGTSSDSTVFADALTFTTTIMGSASPHVIITPIGDTWGLAAPPADLLGSASRIDKHTLIIGLSLDEAKGTTARPGVPLVSGSGSKSALQRGNVYEPTEQSALDAVVQLRLDAYLDRALR